MRIDKAAYVAVFAIAITATWPACAGASDAKIYLTCRIVTKSGSAQRLRFEVDEIAQTVDGGPAQISPSSIKVRINISEWTIDRYSGAVEVRATKDYAHLRVGQVISTGSCERVDKRKF